MSNNSIWPIDRTLPGATTSGQCGPGNDGNEGIFHIPHSSSITGALPSDYLVSYPGNLGESYSSAVIQLVYSTAPAEWAMQFSIIPRTPLFFWWVKVLFFWKWYNQHIADRVWWVCWGILEKCYNGILWCSFTPYQKVSFRSALTNRKLTGINVLNAKRIILK